MILRLFLAFVVCYIIGTVGGLLLWLVGTPYSVQSATVILCTLVAGVLASRWIMTGSRGDE